jgi:transposase-like protein
MRKLKDIDGLFNGCHFDREVIVLCVRWYLRYKLSFRDLAEMMAERGLALAHTTIMRWVRRLFDLTNLRLKDNTAPAVWKAVLSAR